MVSGVAIALAGVMAVAPAQQPPAGNAAPRSECGISDDPAYGYSKAVPIDVGGGAMYVAAREHRYMDALRGPRGQPIRYRRRGSLPQDPSDPDVILDEYEVIYDGLNEAVTLYLNAYKYDDRLMAPRGFTCGVRIALAPPGPDLFLAADELAALAREEGAARTFAPIPVETGGAAIGAMLDRFRIIAQSARGESDRQDSAPEGTLIVAYPRACGERLVAPSAIDMVSSSGAVVPQLGPPASTDALKPRLPGLEFPEGSLATAVRLSMPRAGDVVRITYSEPCNGSDTVAVPVTFTPVRALQTPMPKLPADAQGEARPVYLQCQVDFDGRLRRPHLVGGPEDLAPAAIDAISHWTTTPAMVNGAPVSMPVVVRLTFTR